MAAKNRICDFLFYMLVGTLYAYALSRAVFDATIIDIPDVRLTLLCAGALLLLYFVLFNRYTALVALGAVLVAGAVVYLLLRRQDFDAAWFRELADAARELLLFSRNLLPHQPGYDRILSIFATGLLSLLIAVNLRPRFNFIPLSLLGVGVIAVPIYMDWGKSEIGIPLFLLCFFVFLARRLNLTALLKEQAAKGPVGIYALMTVPVGLTVFLTAWLLPKPDLSTDGVWRSSGGAKSLSDVTGNLFGGSATIAYTDDGSRLGGPNTLSDAFVMEVWSDGRPYLTGSVRDTYTGSSWETSQTGWETLEPDNDGVYATSEYTAEQMNQQQYYMRYYDQTMQTVTVDIGDARTRTVFAPPFRTSLTFPEEGGEASISMNRYGALAAERSLPRNSRYTQQYIGWNLNNSYIIGLLQASGDTERQGLDAYLQLPDSLPDRVRDLADQLTQDKQNSYDKLKALEAYLAAFPYTLEPDSVPRGEDFVDYFLFTGQEGYCVYFASALAVMGRCVDVPTRYVEGFAMPAETGEQGSYIVTGQQAHAWVEAYFPGLGWVTFEPTPPSYAGFYGEEPTEVQEPAPSTPEEQEVPEADPDGEPIPPEEPEVPEAPAVPDNTEPEAGKAPFVVVLLCVLGAVGMSILFLWIFHTARRSRAARLERMPNREAAETYFAALLRSAGLMGYPLLRGETAHAWAARLHDRLTFDGGAVRPVQLADIYAAAAYSETEISDAQRRLMRRCSEELLLRLKEGSLKNRLFYLLHRIAFT